MMECFDAQPGRHYYSQRMRIVEPDFGNARATLGMDCFALRGRRGNRVREVQPDQYRGIALTKGTAPGDPRNSVRNSPSPWIKDGSTTFPKTGFFYRQNGGVSLSYAGV
jgi:hypothetical protein